MSSAYLPDYLPDGLSRGAICVMEGCRGRGPCPDCGETNYRLMGYYGAIASAAKLWGVSEDEAESRIHDNFARACKRCSIQYGEWLTTNEKCSEGKRHKWK